MRVAGGLTDRTRPVRFTFDGHPVEGFQGDTVASALLAHGTRLVGRSFKYHRPRGVVTAGSDEPNALVTTGRGAGQTPNVRATMQEVFDGLEVSSQNAWPSVGFDILAANDLLSPFLGAGFYYKTFMWPRRFWEGLYEPFIRRAAGLGALSGLANADRYEKAYAFCDLLVIGGGPSGLIAALIAGRAGADVILADEDSRFGGRLNAERESVGGQPGADWAAGVVAELAQMPNVRLMPRTTVTGAYDGGTFGALERVNLHRPAPGHGPLECFWRIVAKQALLCAGASERLIAFRDNDRPGIMTASAVRTYLNRFGAVGGARVAVFGNNDDAHRTARDIAAAGLQVTALIDCRPDARLHAGQTQVGFPVYTGAVVTGTSGRQGLTGLTLRHQSGTAEIEADVLAVSGGWNPALHLTCHRNNRPAWNPTIAAFVPQPGAVPGMEVAGAALGVFSTRGALKSGQLRVKACLEALGLTAPSLALPEADDGDTAITPFWAVEGKGRAWLDLQNDVTVKDVKLAAQENYTSVEHMKRYTTLGMATDQGRMANVPALAILADATGRGIVETGTTTYRPPFTPVSIAAMGAGGQGAGFAPQRFTTSHAASLERGAPMIEAGLWYRPSYFPKAGEGDWRTSCDREVGYVRNAVGVCDVSTLGKIDLQGPDVAEFLDFVYTNTFSTLAVGRARYGLMLREDGYVMDDGTSARLGPGHFVMTTTTAAAGQVMKHLEFVHQALKPHLKVRFTSVTEHWAQFSVAGPRSLELLNTVLETPVSDAEYPFMGCGAVTVAGIPGRLFRISFSGERAYEVAVPSRHGDSLYRLLVAQAEALGGGPYGMEALNVLRIEKGFITHAEIHGRTTAFDIGLQGMVSGKKDCVGKTLSQRPGLMEDREELVGLRPVDGITPLSSGAHLFAEGAPPVRENDEGYTTSWCISPTLGVPLALGFLKDGRARHGNRIRLVDSVRGIDTICTVTHPVAFDPEGGRARG
jgi:heterotetrameric sarcosine oxidase alpha subunit